MSLHRRMFLTLLAIAALLVAVGAVSALTHSRLRDRFDRLHLTLTAGLANEDRGIGPEVRALSAQATQASRLVLGMSIGAAALAFLVAFPLWRSIARPIGVLHRAALDIDAGRLDTRVNARSLDGLRTLGSTLNSVAERLALSMQCVAALRAAQATLQQSLDEKELLLREVHHRVKNNLQVVSSLLDLQARSVGNRVLMEEFEVSQSRIRCMALVHEQLYGAGQFDRLGTREYLNRLASRLVGCFGQPTRIRLRLELEDLHLDVDRAMTVGLLTNELLSNSLKHAFPADRSGEVRLMLASHEDACVLTVADDGVGMRPQPAKEGCLGMSLVTTLAKQLHGSVSVECLRGTRVCITFPMAKGVPEKAVG